jgi:DNA-binding NarL/FixJ family response regulator
VSPHTDVRETSVRKIRCVLVHEHILLRQGLRRLLEDESDLEIVSEAGNGAECLRKVFEFRPDVVITNAGTFGLSAWEIELLVARESRHTKLVFLGEQEESPSGGLGADAGHSATPQTSVEELVSIVREACHTGDSEAGRVHDAGTRTGAPLQEHNLTTREQEVLKLLAEGKTVRAAANDLGVSSKTVDTHKFNLMRKLGIHNKAALVMWAIQKKVMKIPAGA